MELTNIEERKQLVKQILADEHPQFILDNKKGVMCRCGRKAVSLRGEYLCGTITAYPCKYN